MALKVLMLIIGIVTASVAVLGLVRGRVSCKGGPYSREAKPLAFWSSIGVYLAWAGLMFYFTFFGNM